MSKKYGIKKQDKFNWIIFSLSKVKKGKTKGKSIENVEGYYPTLEKACLKFIDFKIGKKLINKELNEKKILKEIKKVKIQILKEIKKHEKKS